MSDTTHVNISPGLLALYACTVHTLSGGSLAARAGGGGVGVIACISGVCFSGAIGCLSGDIACLSGDVSCLSGAIVGRVVYLARINSFFFRQRRDGCNINVINPCTHTLMILPDWGENTEKKSTQHKYHVTAVLVKSNERNSATWSPAERPWHCHPFMMV